MNPKCPTCGAGSWKNGFSRNGRRVYKCNSCGKKFNERAGTPFWHLKAEEKKVSTASLLYVKYPLSTYQVADLLELFGVKVSASSVGRWPRRFGHSAKKIAKHYKVKISKVWHVDEKFVFSKGRQAKTHHTWVADYGQHSTSPFGVVHPAPVSLQKRRLNVISAIGLKFAKVQ